MLQVDRNPAQTSLSKNRKVMLHRAKSRGADECRDPKAVTKTRLPAAGVAILSKEKYGTLGEVEFQGNSKQLFFLVQVCPILPPIFFLATSAWHSLWAFSSCSCWDYSEAGSSHEATEWLLAAPHSHFRA